MDRHGCSRTTKRLAALGFQIPQTEKGVDHLGTLLELYLKLMKVKNLNKNIISKNHLHLFDWVVFQGPLCGSGLCDAAALAAAAALGSFSQR